MRSTARVKQACDNCRKRKIRCVSKDGEACERCRTRNIACTYNAIGQKKGPKGSRDEVPSEVTKPPHNVQLAAEFPTDLGFDEPSLSSIFAPTPGLLPGALVESCIEYFFDHVYPSEPILRHKRAQEAAVGMDRSPEEYCMIAALCAYVMIQANYKPPVSVLPRSEMSNFDIGRILLEDSVRVRQVYDYRENPSYMSVLTSWLYSECYFGLGQEDTPWTYLREATTQAQLLDMHDDEAYKGDPLDAFHMRMLYLVLFIAERTYALRDPRQISLCAAIYHPSIGDVLSYRPIAVGLEIMVNMFTIADKFINVRNEVHNTRQCAVLIKQVQYQLSNAVPKQLACTNGQKFQIYLTKLWLYSKIWQMRHLEGLLDESRDLRDGPLSPFHPINIATCALTLSNLFEPQGTIILRQRLIEKLCDIADCVVNILQKWPAIPEYVSVNWLLKFWNFMRRLIPTDNKRQDTLGKISEVIAQYPSNSLLNRACGIKNDNGHSLTPYCI